MRFLAKRAGMEVPEEDGDREAGRRRQRLLDLNRDAARFYYQMLQQPEGRAVQEYLDRRKIRKATAVNFGLGASLDSWDALILAMTKKGYTKSELLDAGLAVQNRNGGLYDKFRNRLMFPVIDVRGDVVAFGGRVLDKSEPKYMNSQETPVYSKRRVLYGLNLAKKSKRPNIILCEGNIDVVTLHQAGFDNAVASMGTALTVEQTRLLSRFTKELGAVLRQRQRRQDRHGPGAGDPEQLGVLREGPSAAPAADGGRRIGEAGRRRLHQVPGQGCL